MTALKASAAVAFAASQIFAIGLLISIIVQGYGDDAFSMALSVTFVAAIFGGPAVWLRQYGVRTWRWAVVQAALTSTAVAYAVSLHFSSEVAALAGPFLFAATVPVPVLYLGAAMAHHRFAIRAGAFAIAAAVLLSLPIARL